MGEILAILTAALWAISGILIKNTTGDLGAIQISLIRIVPSALVGVVVAIITGDILELNDIPVSAVGMLLFGSAFVAIGNLIFVKIISMESVSFVFPTTSGLYILFGLIASYIFVDDPFTVYAVIGGFVILVSLYVLSSGKNGSHEIKTDKQTQSYKIIAISAVIAAIWVVGLILFDQAIGEVGPIAGNAIRMPAMVILLGVVTLATGNLHVRKASGKSIGMAAASGVFHGIACVTFFISINLINPATSAILSCTAPLFAAPMAFVFLKEHLSKTLIFGTILCVIGVVITVA